jgi:preprotein translocase subunit SecD
VLRKVLLDEASVSRVYPTRTEAGDRFVIGIQMTKDGAARLKEITAANVGRRLAIVLDGKVLIAPNVQAALAEGIVIDLGRSESFQAVDRAMRRLHAAVYALP